MSTLATIAAGVILSLATAAAIFVAMGRAAERRDAILAELDEPTGIRVNPDREPW